MYKEMAGEQMQEGEGSSGPWAQGVRNGTRQSTEASPGMHNELGLQKQQHTRRLASLVSAAFALSMGMVWETQCEPSTLNRASQSTDKFILLPAEPRSTNINYFFPEISLHLQSCTKQLPLFHFSADEHFKLSGPTVRGGTTPRGIDPFQRQPEGQYCQPDSSRWAADVSDQPTSQLTDLELDTFPPEVDAWVSGQQDGYETLLVKVDSCPLGNTSCTKVSRNISHSLACSSQLFCVPKPWND